MQFAVLTGDPKTGPYTQIRKVRAGIAVNAVQQTNLNKKQNALTVPAMFM
jgi:hypothetical protein